MWSARSYRRASGFTLLEFLIVVAIVVSVLAISVPALRTPFAKAELRAAARQLRAELARARLRAIESGTAWQVRFRPGSREFEAGPRPDVSGSEGLLASGVDRRRRMSAPEPLKQDEPTRLELPPGVCFLGQGPSLTPAAEDAGQEAFRLAAVEDGPTERDQPGWSVPVVFYPNGRASEARVRLGGQRGYAVEVTLRGITGAVQIGELARAESEPNASSQTETPIGTPRTDSPTSLPAGEQVSQTKGVRLSFPQPPAGLSGR